MKVSDLVMALTRASAVMVNSPTMMAYTGAYLVVTESTLTIHASDGDTTVSTCIPTDGDAVAGGVLVAPKPLLSWLKTLSGEVTVTLTVTSAASLDVTADNSAPYTFRTLNATFPVPGAPTDVPVVALEDLAAALSAVATSAGATDDLSGDDVVQLVSNVSALTLYSTDQFRVTRAVLPGAGFGDVTLLMRLKTLQLVAKWKPTGVRVEPTGAVVFTVDSGVVTVRRLEAAFPAASQIVDAPSAYSTTVTGSDVVTGLRRLRALAGGGESIIVSLDADHMQCSVNAEQIGSGTERVALGTPVSVPVKFGVNVDFFKQAFDALNSSEVTLRWTSGTMPVRLSTTTPLDVTVVVMPVRLNDDVA